MPFGHILTGVKLLKFVMLSKQKPHKGGMANREK